MHFLFKIAVEGSTWLSRTSTVEKSSLWAARSFETSASRSRRRNLACFKIGPHGRQDHLLKT